MSAPLVLDESELSSDILQLAARLGVSAELPKVLEMTRDVFPGVQVEVAIEEDPEIADEVCLAIVVRTEIKDAHELFRTSRPWHRRIYDCVHPFLAPAFRLHTGWHQ